MKKLLVLTSLGICLSLSPKPAQGSALALAGGAALAAGVATVSLMELMILGSCAVEQVTTGRGVDCTIDAHKAVAAGISDALTKPGSTSAKAPADQGYGVGF